MCIVFYLFYTKYNFNLRMSVEDFVKVERKVKDVLRKLGPEYEGEYLKKIFTN